MTTCKACGADCDGDVCDFRCELMLVDELEAQRRHDLTLSGLHECAYCGESCRCVEPKFADTCTGCSSDCRLELAS